MSGLTMVHVPYRGTGPALNDLAAGIVDAYFGDPATLGLIQGGKARAMAVTSPERWPLLPDTPASAEAVPGYAAENWYGLAAPPGTPEPIVAAAGGRGAQGDGRSRTRSSASRRPGCIRRPCRAPTTLPSCRQRFRDLGARRRRPATSGWTSD